MNNPFSYGGIVKGETFCNRITEQKDLIRAVENSEKLFIHGERRIGKTSLLKAVIQKIEKNSGICFYIDVWKCLDEDDFSRVCASAFAEYAFKEKQSVVERLKTLFAGITPSFSVDEAGKPSVTLLRARSDKPGPFVDEILKAPQRVRAIEPDRPILVVFDEFQQIREISGLKLEQIIRSRVQEQQNVAYFFCGSRTSLLKKMFLEKSSPLYRSSGHYPIESISPNHWKPFIKTEFTTTGKSITAETITALVEATGGHPFYTQMLCSSLWDITDNTVSVSDLESATDLLLDRESSTYITLWNALPEQPRKMLRALAMENPLFKPTSGKTVQTHGFASPSSSKSALTYLIDRDHAAQNKDGGYFLVDRFLGMWCRRNLTL